MEEKIVDRISQLPEFIVHDILSYLKSPVDLVRMRVLSKTWFALAASYPILDFNLYKIRTALSKSGFPVHGLENSRQVLAKFFEHVAYTISKFCEQNVSVHTFKLVAAGLEPKDIDNINRWIGLIIKKDVQVLELNIHTRRSPLREDLPTQRPQSYRLPNTLLSASSLTSLRIYKCELPSSLMVDGVKFKSLKSLSLDGISIDEEVIKYLATNCPLLEELIVERCHGFKRFCVYGHQNLQKVKTFYGYGVERIDIEAPNLHYLALGYFGKAGAPCINLASCKKLTTLYFYGRASSISNWFAEFFSNFPSIENLFLNICTQSNNLKVSSDSLRKFVLTPCCDLKAIEIDAPNLLSFVYSDHIHTHPVSFPSASTTSGQLKVCMKCYLRGVVDTLWFKMLRRFLGKNNGFKVLKLHIRADFLKVANLKVMQSQPFELEHVELKVGTMRELSLYVAFVDAVFWCCRPRSLSLSLSLSPRSNLPLIGFEGWSHVVKYTYEKLLQQEDPGQTYIKIGLSSASKAKKRFSNLNLLLKALPHDRLGQVVTFIKEKRRNSPRIRMRKQLK